MMRRMTRGAVSDLMDRFVAAGDARDAAGPVARIKRLTGWT